MSIRSAEGCTYRQEDLMDFHGNIIVNKIYDIPLIINFVKHITFVLPSEKIEQTSIFFNNKYLMIKFTTENEKVFRVLFSDVFVIRINNILI